ncbi:MAG: hypothetical protein LBJ11_02040, partial [Oscillospiraceae bacterium]|nr:hypothetical protein [Oscillospiraceae bacterium]
MPNWVTNHLTIEAETEERLHEIMTAIAYDDKGLGTIDFNKINPMPPELDIESGTKTKQALERYTHFIRAAQLTGCVGLQEPLPMSIEDERVKLISPNYEKDADLIAFGAKAYSNKQKYGATDWYYWCSSNQPGHWGTKWNSTPMDDPHEYDGSNRLEFQTAWSPPEPVIVRLSEMYPDAQFRHRWADEDIGMNVGEITYQEGEAIEYDVPSGGSKEAYEMAAEIIGIDLSEYELYYSQTKGSYVNREDLAWEDMCYRAKKTREDFAQKTRAGRSRGPGREASAKSIQKRGQNG